MQHCTLALNATTLNFFNNRLRNDSFERLMEINNQISIQNYSF